MKSLRTIFFVAVVLFLCACPAFGTIEFKDGGTHDIDYEINDRVRVDYQTPDIYTTVNVLDGANIEYPYRLSSYGNSRINVRGGSINDWLYVHENSIATVNSGSVNKLGATCDCTVTINGGTIRTLFTYTTSTTIINNGLISNNIQTQESSEVIINGGTVNNYIHAYDDSTITINGGVTKKPIISHDNCIIDIMG